MIVFRQDDRVIRGCLKEWLSNKNQRIESMLKYVEAFKNLP